jgi:hypothetical protein
MPWWAIGGVSGKLNAALNAEGRLLQGRCFHRCFHGRDAMGPAPCPVNTWEQLSPEFSEFIKRGKAKADALVSKREVAKLVATEKRTLRLATVCTSVSKRGIQIGIHGKTGYQSIGYQSWLPGKMRCRSASRGHHAQVSKRG